MEATGASVAGHAPLIESKLLCIMCCCAECGPVLPFACCTFSSLAQRMRDWVEATEASAAEASAADSAGALAEGPAVHFLDPDLRIPSYWSAIEADVIQDLPAARAVWEHVLHSRYAAMCRSRIAVRVSCVTTPMSCAWHTCAGLRYTTCVATHVRCVTIRE